MKKQILTISCSILCIAGLQAQSWEPIEDMPSAKHHPVTFSIDGLGYSITGFDPAIGASKDVYRYDPADDSWTELSAFPGAARSYAIGHEYKGLGYIGFGQTNTGSFLRDIFTYNPQTEEWDLLTICDCDARRHPAFLVTDEKIFVGLGNDAFGDLNDFWMYDIQLDEWTQLPDLPGLPRHHPFQFVVDGEVYTGLGHGGPVIYDDWYRFDQDAMDWVELNDFPGEARVAGTQFNHGEFGYVLSGDGSNHSWMNEGEFWQYDPTSDEWEQLPSHPGTSRWAPGSFVIDNTVYFFGGENRPTQTIVETGYKYDALPPLEPVAGIDEKSDLEIRIWPNPATRVLNLDVSEGIRSISVFSLSGQMILMENSGLATLDVASVPSGVYFATIETLDGKNATIKWIKE